MIRNRSIINHHDNFTNSIEQGMDVVDNAMSKLAYPIRPPSKKKRKEPRRNSQHANNKIYPDDFTDVLSKSVPTTLPSQLHYSDDSDNEQASRDEHHFSDHHSLSFYSVGTLNSSNDASRNASHIGTLNASNEASRNANYIGTLNGSNEASRNANYSGTLNASNEASRNASYIGTPNRSNDARNVSYISTPKSPDLRQIEKIPTPSLLTSFILTALFVVALAMVCTKFMNKSNVSNTSVYDEFKFYTDISGLGEKYNVDENSILQVQTGISTIFEKDDTGSFIFVYNSNAKDFNPIEFNKFMNAISFAASKYLRNESTPHHYTTVEGTTLDMDDHSELICRYRDALDRSGVMLVHHVEDIPSHLAMAFHYYCDEYNPLVKKSAIFFTLDLAKCLESENKTSHALIEKCLAKKWNGVPIDSIGPLLTRVVSVVIDVTNAF